MDWLTQLFSAAQGAGGSPGGFPAMLNNAMKQNPLGGQAGGNAMQPPINPMNQPGASPGGPAGAPNPAAALVGGGAGGGAGGGPAMPGLLGMFGRNPQAGGNLFTQGMNMLNQQKIQPTTWMPPVPIPGMRA